MTDEAIFLFGGLRHAPLREIVLDGALSATPAEAPGWQACLVVGGDAPVLVPSRGGRAPGLLLQGLDAARRARLNFFARGHGLALHPVTVELAGAQVPALCYQPEGAAAAADPWRLEDWRAAQGALTTLAAGEAMAWFGRIAPDVLAARMPMIRARAASRLRARDSAPATLRSAMNVTSDVEVIAARRPYADYFALDEAELRFRRFDGTMSPPVSRAGFVGGDAVTVLPYDPAADTVLVVEQFRMGPYLRGDPLPWQLEPIAGRVDPGEAVETTARREALEEAGLALGALHFVSGHYPSPGAVTEFIYAYVALADLSGLNGTVAGLASEGENIRSHVIPFERLMALVQSGEAACGPLVVSAFWLGLNRARLLAGA